MKHRDIFTRAKQRIMGERPRWKVLSEFISTHGYKSYAEVGVWAGDTVEYLMVNTNLKEYHLIDPYDAKQGYEGGSHDKENQAILNNAKNLTIARVKMYNKVSAAFYFTTSLEAARKFAGESIDIVFIDGRHDYDSVKADIGAWWPKVRPGGILCGHDYNNRWKNHVVRAVDEKFGDKVTLQDDAVWFVMK